MTMSVNQIRRQLEYERRMTASRLRELGSPVDPKHLEGTARAEERSRSTRSRRLRRRSGPLLANASPSG